MEYDPVILVVTELFRKYLFLFYIYTRLTKLETKIVANKKGKLLS